MSKRESLNPIGDLECRYLKFPIQYGYGLVNKIRETKNKPTDRKKLAFRLGSPFFSIGTAMRYYYEQMEKGSLHSSPYHTYMFNLGDQLHIYDELEAQLKAKNEADAATAKATALIQKANTLASAPAETETPKPKKTSSVRVWTPRHQEIANLYMAPRIRDLETHGGTLSRADYEANDPTLRNKYAILNRYTAEVYNEQKIHDALARGFNKKKNRPESKLYYIDFRKNIETKDAIKQIPVDHPSFLKYTETQHRTTVAKYGRGTRTVWYGGPFSNKRASNLIFGQRRAKKFKLRGPVYCLCTPDADLSIVGGISLDPTWKGPEVDTGDQSDPEAGTFKRDKIRPEIPAEVDLTDEDESEAFSEDEESESDEELPPKPPVVVTPPAPVKRAAPETQPPVQARKKPKTTSS